jgi:hypothetical protein
MQTDTPTPDAQAAPVVCRYLRSKGAGVVYGDAVRWENGYFPTAVFWCLATVEPVGPDDGIAHPHACIASRSCFCDNAAT